MVQEVISVLTEIGEKVGTCLKRRNRLTQPVRLIYTDENDFSSCLITPQGNTFAINTIEERQPHSLSSLYSGAESIDERNRAWWKLCFYFDGSRYVIDDYYRQLPIAEDSRDTIGSFLHKQEDALYPFSRFREETVFITGRFASALPLLYQLQEKYRCTLFDTQEVLAASLGPATPRVVYIPATVQCLQAMTGWGVTVNELIPGGRTIEENCLSPTCCCGNSNHYILLKMWLETHTSQELRICTECANAPIQKISLWKH